MTMCCECGKEIDEDSDDAILEVPFAEGTVHFCSKKCYDDATKI